MATVSDILAYMDAIAPYEYKEDWDRVGLNCGHLNQEVKTVLVALDPFEHVCREAKDVGAQLLITHHALIWQPGFVTDDSEQGKNVLYLIENGIAHMNAHTNLDYADGGVNDVLAHALGLEDVKTIASRGVDSQGNPWGLLRQGTVSNQTLDAFLAHVKQTLGCCGLRFVDAGMPVSRVAVGGGSCADMLKTVAQAGCDTFVTADVKYNQFWDALSLGVNLIDAGHFYTENPVCHALAEKLQKAFPEITVLLSKNHHDCMKFF